MKEINDELIMAFVDGELDGQLAREVEESINRDPEAMKKADIFRDSAAMLRGVYDTPLYEPVPERLVESVREYGKGQRTHGLRDFFARFLHFPKWQPAFAMAVVLLLVLGMAGGYLVSMMVSEPGRLSPVLLTSGEFSQGLDRTISGRTFTIAGAGIRVTPIATFKDKEGHYCRQYEILSGKDGKHTFAQGVACRTPSGKWQVLVYVASGASPGPEGIQGSKYVPAGQEDLVEDIVNKLMASPPLSQGQEEQLIANGWKQQ